MIYVGDEKLDLSDKELVRFLQTATPGSQWQPIFTDVPGYVTTNTAPKSLGAAPYPSTGYYVRWTIVQTWGIYELANSGRQKVSETKVRMQAARAVEITVSVQLLVQENLPAETRQKLESIFSAYQYPSSGNVDAYITQAIASDSSLNLLMIGLAKRITVTPIADTLYDERELDNLRRWIYKTGDDNLFTLMLLGETQLDSIETPQKGKNQTELGDPERAAKGVAGGEQERAGCREFETLTWEVARTDWIPDTRWTWGWHLVEIGCTKFHFYYPTGEARDVDLVIQAYVSVPRGLKPVENAIKKCAEDAALAAAVYLLLFTDFSGALIGFKALFVDCIKGKFNEALACVDAGLVSDTKPDGDWHQI